MGILKIFKSKINQIGSSLILKVLPCQEKYRIPQHTKIPMIGDQTAMCSHPSLWLFPRKNCVKQSFIQNYYLCSPTSMVFIMITSAF